MRSKTILSIAAFTVAFVLSTAFASLFITKIAYQSESVVTPSYSTKKTSCFKNRGKNYVADKIETFVKQDVSNGRERDRKLYQIDGDFRSSFSSSSFNEYSEVVSEYVSASENLSAENTPRDFQKAWSKHLNAWRDYANFLDKMEHSSAEAELRESELSELENTYSSDINNTWYEVLRVGRNHGAEVY